jgi:hypothetical protein
MCGARLLADVLVDTAAGQATASYSDGPAAAPAAPLPEQFEALFRPMAEPRPIDATQPMSVLPIETHGLPPAPPSPVADDEIGGDGGRRRVFVILGAGATLVALVVVIAVLLLGDSGTAAAGRPNTPDAITTAAASSSVPPAAAINAPAVTTTTAPTTTHAASTKASAPKTTATTKATTANRWAGNLSYGSRGSRVRQAQQALQSLHLYYGKITGVYDVPTTESVAIFQTSHGITADPYGTVGQTTWNALMKAAG